MIRTTGADAKLTFNCVDCMNDGGNIVAPKGPRKRAPGIFFQSLARIKSGGGYSSLSQSMGGRFLGCN